MKFLSVRELRGHSAKVWAELPTEREMVITNNGRPVAILTTVGEANVEESLAAIRRARAETAITLLQKRSTEKGIDRIRPEEIEAEIAQVRKNRPK